MRLRRNLSGLIVATALVASIPADLRAASFQGLGHLGGQSQAFGVSADGSVVVGSVSGSGNLRYVGFRWDAENGMVPLGALSQTSRYTAASGISGDGSTVVGVAEEANGQRRAVLWEGTVGPIVLEDLEISSQWTQAFWAEASTFGGAVVVGQSRGHAFRWDPENGTVSLGGLPGVPTIASSAGGVDDDGSVIVGGVTTEIGTQPFRWNSEQGMVGLGSFAGAPIGGFAQAVSSDGSVVVGSSLSASSMTRAFRWDALHGMAELGELPAGYVTSAALGVSADGSTAVGFIREAGLADFLSNRAAYWDEAGQVHELSVFLRAMGLDLAGWTLISAQDVSADGRTIVGSGINPTGQIEAWIAVIPEPGTSLLIAVGLTMLGGLRSRTES